MTIGAPLRRRAPRSSSDSDRRRRGRFQGRLPPPRQARRGVRQGASSVPLIGRSDRSQVPASSRTLSGRMPKLRVTAVVVVLGLLTASCTGGTEGPPDAGPAPPEAGVPVTPRLTMRLVRATGKTEGGTLRPSDIAEPAEAIRRDLEELYETAFLAPSLDRQALFSHFSGDARREAERDLARLTIGPVRGELDEVVPRRATVSLTLPRRCPRTPAGGVRPYEVPGLGRLRQRARARHQRRGLRAPAVERRLAHRLLRRAGTDPTARTDAGAGRAGGVRAGAALERPPLRPGDRQRRPARPVGRQRARGLDPHRRRQPGSGTRLDPGDPARLVGDDPGVGDEQDQRRARAAAVPSCSCEPWSRRPGSTSTRSS